MFDKKLKQSSCFITTPLVQVFPPKLIDAIQNLGFSWTLRLHPRNSFNSDEILDFLVKKGVDKEKIVIEQPKDNPLPLSLLNSHLHITNYSGCLIEAIQMGVPSLIIDETGEAIYKNYIDGDLVVYKNKFDTDFEHFLQEYVKPYKTRPLNLYDIPNPLD